MGLRSFEQWMDALRRTDAVQVRTALAALAALLLLAAIVPHGPSSESDLATSDRELESSPPVAVDREGPRGEGHERPHGEDGPPEAALPAQDHAAAIADRADDGDRDENGQGQDGQDGDGAGEGDAVQDGEEEHQATEGEPQVIYGYDVEVRGEVATDTDEFEATLERILSDARGWTLGGSLAFERNADAPDLTVVLASPDEVEDTHEVCSRDYSCRVEDEMLINDRNWREATPAWHDADGDLATYRRYLINHEVGHFLGFGHVDCSGEGDLAPVMQQQSVSMEECEPNGWPLDWERERLAGQLDTSVR